jgi:hypothetical protein
MENDLLQLGYTILESQFKISDGRISDQDIIDEQKILYLNFRKENPDILNAKFKEYDIKIMKDKLEGF